MHLMQVTKPHRYHSYYDGAASSVPSDGNTLALMIVKCAIFMETGLAVIFRTVTVTEPSTVHHISDAPLITETPFVTYKR